MKKLVCVLLALYFLPNFTFAEDKKIGFVNISDVLAKYERRKDEEANFKESEEKVLARTKSQKAELDKLADELKTTDNEEDRSVIMINMLKLKKEIESYTEFQQEYFKMEMVKKNMEIMREIKSVISDYGQEKKFFMILQTQPPKPSYGNYQEAVLQMNYADVLYYDKQYDITDEIVVLLNTRYRNKKANTTK